MRILGLLVVFSLISLPLMAQEDWENDGEIEDVEIEIIKDLEITLPRANRNFDKIAPVNIGDGGDEVTYYFNTINFTLPALDLKMRPLRIKDQPISKLYGNYVKAGFGNYTTPYFEGFFNSKRNNQYAYGAHVNYLNSKTGPVDDENSGSGNFGVDLFGKAFGKIATLSGELNYDRDKFHFYGYDDGVEVGADSIRQIYNTVRMATSISNTDKSSAVGYNLGISYQNTSDDFEAKEGIFGADLYTSYSFSDEASVKLKAEYNLISREDELLNTTRNLLKLKPLVLFEVSGINIEAGFNAIYEDDTLGGADELHFFPLAKASYDLSDYLKVYAGISGDIQKQTYNSLIAANPYLQSNQQVFHNHKTFDFYAGIEGKVTSKIGFGAGFSLANYQNLHYFINDPTDQSRFVVAYDPENTAVANVFGEISVTNDKLRATLRGDYFGYDVNESIGDEAWHRPNYQFSLLSTYNLYDKLLLGADFYAFGGINAIDFNNGGETITLDPGLDLNLKADYLISSQVSAFVQFNNIFSQSYEQFYRYPSRQLQFIAGVTYSF
ncbi:MAG: TonB-dependent receptor [Fulvivirga sp.]